MSGLRFNLALAEYAANHVRAVMAKGLGPHNRPESVVHRVDKTPPPTVESGPSPAPAQGGLQGMQDALFGTPWSRMQQAQNAVRAEWQADFDGKIKAKQAEIQQAVERQRDTLQRYSNILYTATAPLLDSARAAIRIGGIVQQSCLGNCGEQSCVAFRYLVARGASGLAIVNWKSSNHTFVVIGMDANVGRLSQGSLVDPPRWGNDAVVCDPWYHEWFPAQSADDWRTKMKRIIAETNDLAPETIDRDAAAAKGRLISYDSNMRSAGTFERLTFLLHGDDELMQLASMNDALSNVRNQLHL